MSDALPMQYLEVGVCGLSCRLCPMYNTQSENRCLGCKSSGRIAVGCPFITCAVKQKKFEFCWQCPQNATCKKWKKHRDASKRYDSFKCYQKLEDDIQFILKQGVDAFECNQKIREQFLKEMLAEFDNGRSKSYYCIAATVLEIAELQNVLSKAKKQTDGLPQKEKAKVMHSILDEVAIQKGIVLKLRK